MPNFTLGVQEASARWPANETPNEHALVPPGADSAFHAVFENERAGLRVGDDVVEAAGGAVCGGERVLQGRRENRGEAGGCEHFFGLRFPEGDIALQDIEEVDGGVDGGAEAESR